MNPRRQWVIGRAGDCDVVVDNPAASSHHCRLLETPEGFLLEDLGSTNGTFVNGLPVNGLARVNRGDRILLGLDVPFPWPADVGFSPRNGEADSGNRCASLTVSFQGLSLVLGRDSTCDQVLNHPLVSRRHARLLRNGDVLVLEDLGSTNGTFLNGRRVERAIHVRSGDEITLGSFTFRLTRQGQLEKRDQRGNVTIEARDLAVDVPGTRLLEDVSLTILPGELVGLMGLAGAGKTTLMTALNGYTRPAEGHVLVNGENLYAHYARFATAIGYVPQDDIMHRDLTVGQALYYSARLRLPADYSNADIRKRIGEVLGQLGLVGTENIRIGSPERKGISGGQRRRVNLAMELLTDPLVLFLDEPTSGLSSEDALVVMECLRQLADSGKTILLTIHQPNLEVFRLMDNLAVVSRDPGSSRSARMVYYGPAYPHSLEFFNPEGIPGARPGSEPSPDDVLRGLRKRSTDEWVSQYAASRYRKDFVLGRAGRRPEQAVEATTSGARDYFDFPQWWTLVQRCLAVKLKDTWNTTILLAQAPIVAALVVAVLGERAIELSIFVLGLAALWFGCSNAVREIVGEWAIYRRERMVNLRLAPYVASKLATLGLLCFVQSIVLLGIVHWGCNLKGPSLAMLLLLFIIGLVGVTIGLTLSAVARTTEVAVALLPIVLLPMVILGGAMQPLANMSPRVRLLSYGAPSRWAFEGMLLLENDAHPAIPTDPVDGEPSPVLDLAERMFPKAQIRVGVPASVGSLAAFLFTFVLAVHGVLRARDLH